MKRILVVGMLDSVHFARWLSQFINQDLEITVFPSSRFKRLHPNLKSMIMNNQVKLNSIRLKSLLNLAGYLDFIRFESFAKVVRLGSRSSKLRRELLGSHFDTLHLIELQHAGYLYLETRIGKSRLFKVISTNYGSDLVFFISFPEHETKLRELLQQSDYYSAECRRDYYLAKQLGFTGVELPLIPNAGGFTEQVLNSSIYPLRKRKLIYIKGNGGQFGLGDISLKVADRLLSKFPHIEVVVVSLSDELRDLAIEIEARHGKRFRVFRNRATIHHEQVLEILRNSIIYIGASRSDGISTTFLEAIISGAVPIQTDTSCASEWVEKGFFAVIVPPLEEAIFESAKKILEEVEIYEQNVIMNITLAKQILSETNISVVARSFYSL